MSGNHGVIDETLLGGLRSSFRGRLVRPGEPDYGESRRIWNGSIDRRPALIAYCTGAPDVAAAVRFARASGLPVAVRSGGHSFSGQSLCDDGIVIDLSPMRRITVDAEARTVRAQAGVLLGELDQQTQRAGLAVPSGIVTHTGLAGLTLGGGIGWLMRKYGLTVDQLLAVTLVTADGGTVRADATENPELFWGVRGGGGNFGVVTEFEYRLHPVGPTVLAGPLIWPVADSARLLRFYRDWITEVPDELTTAVVHRKAPPLPEIPAALHGRRVAMVICCWAGDLDRGEQVLRPLRRFGPPVADLCRPKPFTEHQAMLDPSFPAGRWYYFKSCDVAELTDQVIDITAEHAARITSPLTSFPIFQLGGAIARVGEDETAVGGRQAGHTFNINGTCADAEGFEQERTWARGLWTALAPHHTGVYVNFLMEEGEQRVRQAYGEAKYLRLKALKRQWDPDNLFRLNQNIRPD
ncbi:FAD/FMN-containing dehydrogenase [Kitasatospora gansuensis]|uniref:FAD/FMN-containing dehydrogenase n=1 Tax=Kitasatospora gansuensis TaxID=258050 RepID=A0A7W7SH45_9ACTN|nr:FAD-binding oxidoreductase [Kitasatospora gansuensis]MBB4950374.1 FAD/FMN-containing dehydrogenase [Kitasatospora gansuensis]